MHARGKHIRRASGAATWVTCHVARGQQAVCAVRVHANSNSAAVGTLRLDFELLAALARTQGDAQGGSY